MLIGNKKGGYYFYCKNGTASSRGSGPSGSSGYSIGHFASVEDFLKSDYNKNGDKSLGRYTRDVEFKTDKSTDDKMRAAALAAIKSFYNVVGTSCIDVASDALIKAKLDPGNTLI